MNVTQKSQMRHFCDFGKKLRNLANMSPHIICTTYYSAFLYVFVDPIPDSSSFGFARSNIPRSNTVLERAH